MITGELKSKVDRIWATMWSGGISNPLSVIEQLTYLLFIKRLDELHTLKENKAARTKKPIEDPVFTPKQNALRWSRFQPRFWGVRTNVMPSYDGARCPGKEIGVTDDRRNCCETENARRAGGRPGRAAASCDVHPTDEEPHRTGSASRPAAATPRWLRYTNTHNRVERDNPYPRAYRPGGCGKHLGASAHIDILR